MSRALAFQKSVFGDHFGETENHCVGGHCSCCGGCCSDIFPVTKKELDTLRKFVRSHHYKPHTQLKMGMTATYDMTCPFLNEEKKCDIYDIRPETCRLFKRDTLNPFTMEEFVKQPIELQKAYLNLASKLPEAVSLREQVFGKKVPF